MIQKLNEVDTIQALTLPGERNIFSAPLEQHLQLPGIFLMGEKWYLEHSCKQCGSDVQVRHVDMENKDSGWFFSRYLSWSKMPDVQMLDELAALFGLTINTDFSGDQPGTYRTYYLTGIYKGMARIAYYQCPQCSSQYLMAYMDAYAVNERSPEPDEVYVERIFQVRVDHDLFMKRSSRNGG